MSSRRGDVIIDVLVALAAAATMLVGTHLVSAGPSSPKLDLFGAALLAVSAAPLLVRRRKPLAALAGTAAIAFTYDALNYPAGFYTIALFVGLYTLAESGRRTQALAGVAAIVAAFALVDVFFQRGHVLDWSTGLWFSGWLLVSVAAGEFVHGRRVYLEQIEQRALDAERTREEEARRRAGEERMRIARELHDILAHSISLINVQASAALHVLDRDPEKARAALRTIDQTSRDALRELRATLGVLGGADDTEGRAPAPGLSRIDELVASASASGVRVQLDVRGERRPLPPSVDLAAYRIVQESLTNVVRHARSGAADITITFAPPDLLIEVVDDGAGVPSGWRANGGRGLVGMRERAIAVGGELDAGPRIEGGFRVRARLAMRGAG